MLILVVERVFIIRLTTRIHLFVSANSFGNRVLGLPALALATKIPLTSEFTGILPAR